MVAQDPSSLLDLYGITNICAGFGSNSNDVNRHYIKALNGGMVDSSQVTDFTAPVAHYDLARVGSERRPVGDLS